MDPKQPSSERQARILIERHGCRLYRHGRAWRIVGPGVDILTCDLSAIHDADFHVPKAKRLLGRTGTHRSSS